MNSQFTNLITSREKSNGHAVFLELHVDLLDILDPLCFSVYDEEEEEYVNFEYLPDALDEFDCRFEVESDAEFSVFFDPDFEPKPIKKRKESLYPFKKMQVGQYFLIECGEESRATIVNRVNQAAMRFGVSAFVKKSFDGPDEEPGTSYWRVYHAGYVGS